MHNGPKRQGVCVWSVCDILPANCNRMQVKFLTPAPHPHKVAKVMHAPVLKSRAWQVSTCLI